MEVEYRDVVGFPGYRVGSDGSVWSCRNRWGVTPWRQMRPRRNGKTNHLSVTVQCGKSVQVKRYVHVLVLEAFLGACPNGMEACHAPDPNPENNHTSNLRWDTHKENIMDRARAGGGAMVWNKLSELQIADVLRRLKNGEKGNRIAADFAVTPAAISYLKQKRVQ